MKSKSSLGITFLIILTIMCMENIPSTRGSCSAKSLWDLELDKEVSKADFNSWMDEKGFEAFRWFLLKRDPEYWRVDPCPAMENFCLIMEDRKTSSHIFAKLKKPVALSADLKLIMEYMVEKWPEETDLAKKNREDAALRVFLTADLDGAKVHLGLAATRDHKPGEVIASERKPEDIKYLVLAMKTSEKGVWLHSSTPVAASFRKAFGSFEKGKILAIGLKSDGNNTDSDVKVWLRELKLE